MGKEMPEKQQTLSRKSDLLMFEKKAFKKGYKFVAGVDEAGRGPLAGPVVAVACLIEKGLKFPGINDSKLLTQQVRKRFYEELVAHPLVSYGVGVIDAGEIDRINILEATKLAMKEALDNLQKTPDYLLIDAVKLTYKELPVESIIEGDRKSQTIAAASIIAKETRDEKMKEYHTIFPQYGFAEHKGYGTKKHLEAIAKHGPCLLHRLSFGPLKHG